MRRGPRTWTDEEWNRILNAIDATPGGFCFHPRFHRAERKRRGEFSTAAQYWRTLVLLARDTGMSLAGVIRLARDQLAGNGTLVVKVGVPPTDFIVRLKPDTMDAVKRMPSIAARLLDWPTTRRHTLVVQWRKILRRAGFTRDEARGLWPGEPRFCTGNVCGGSAPLPADTSPSTLLQFYEHYYLPLKLGGRRPRTDVLYRYTVANFGRYLTRPALLSDLNDRTVGGLLEWMRSRQLSPFSVQKERDQLLAQWRFACQLHFVRDYPNIPREIVPNREPLAWMPDELQRLFEAAAAMPGKFGQIPKADFWTALLWTLHETGERISAVLSLHWDHFDLTRGWVVIPAEFRKGGRADKRSKLRAEAVAAVKRLPRLDSGKVFPFTYGASALWYYFGEVLRAAGLPTDRKSKFHRIRKTVASLYEAAGHNATELLGHSCRSVTRKYLDGRIVQVKHVADVLPNPLAAEGGEAL